MTIQKGKQLSRDASKMLIKYSSGNVQCVMDIWV